MTGSGTTFPPLDEQLFYHLDVDEDGSDRGRAPCLRAEQARALLKETP
jgi:hypothetical protein